MQKFAEMLRYLCTGFISPGPRNIDIELTNRCNLRCSMCWFHGENGIGDLYRHKEMKTAEVLGLLDQLAPYRPGIYFGGAEPFIRKDFLTILGYTKTLGLPVSFATNGTLWDQEKVRRVVDWGVDKINFSIDGDAGLHDALRGNGVFGKAVSNIKSILAYKKDKGKQKPIVNINLTVHPLIIGRMQETIDSIGQAIGDGIDSYRIHHPWYVTLKDLKSHQMTVRKYLRCEAAGAKAHYMPAIQGIDGRALAQEITRLRSPERISCFPDFQDHEIRQYYSEDYPIVKRCTAPFRAAVVKPSGDVKFCPDEWIDGYILGNIRTTRFKNIWNGKQARHFRSVIFWKNSFPACKRCVWMHSH